MNPAKALVVAGVAARYTLGCGGGPNTIAMKIIPTQTNINGARSDLELRSRMIPRKRRKIALRCIPEPTLSNNGLILLIIFVERRATIATMARRKNE